MGTKMDDVLDELVLEKGGLRLRTADIIFLLAVTAFAFLARFGLLSYVSGDYTSFLSEWFDTLKSAGGLAGIGLDIGDYTPPYLYILALLTYLPVGSLYSIKLVSCLFDFLLAVFAAKTVFCLSGSRAKSILAYTLVLFCPTVVLNGSAWAQCDAVFTFFLLLSFYSALKCRPWRVCLFFGIAFAFKLQAVFFAPLLLFLLLRGMLRVRHLLLIPLVYFISIIPAWIAGRGLFDLLTIYIGQAGQYRNLSKNAPNLWSFLASVQNSGLSLFAVMLAGTAAAFLLYLLWDKCRRVTPDALLSAALAFLLLIPFLLPHMHERYFFPADLFSILYVVNRPRRFIVPLLTVGASAAAYLPFLFGQQPVALTTAAVLMGAALLLVLADLLYPLFAPAKKGQASS